MSLLLCDAEADGFNTKAIICGSAAAMHSVWHMRAMVDQRRILIKKGNRSRGRGKLPGVEKREEGRKMRDEI